MSRSRLRKTRRPWRRSGSAALPLAALLVTAPGAAPQGLEPVAPGARVRITALGLGLVKATGTVRESSGGGLTLELDDHRADPRVRTIDRAQINQLDLSVRRKRNFVRGLGIGGLTGGTLGIFAGLASGDDECRRGEFCIFELSAGDKAVLGALGGGLLGGAAGLLIGGLVKRDVWTAVLRDETGLAIRPALGEGGRGVRIGIVLRAP